MRKTLNLKKYNMYIYFLLYLLFSMPFSIIFLYIILAKIFKENNKEESTGQINISKAIILILNIVIIFILMIAFVYGVLDEGLVINNIRILPTYTFLYYSTVYFLYLIINKERSKKKYTTKREFAITLGVLFPLIYNQIQGINIYLLNINTSKLVYINEIFQIVFIAAITEEIFFRGFIYDYMKKIFHKNIAEVLTSLIFVFWHIPLMASFFYNPNIDNLINIIAIFMLSFVNCRIYEKTNSLVIPIILHCIVNGFIPNFLSLIYLIVK